MRVHPLQVLLMCFRLLWKGLLSDTRPGINGPNVPGLGPPMGK